MLKELLERAFTLNPENRCVAVAVRACVQTFACVLSVVLLSDAYVCISSVVRAAFVCAGSSALVVHYVVRVARVAQCLRLLQLGR